MERELKASMMVFLIHSKEASQTEGNSILCSQHMKKKLIWDPMHSQNLMISSSIMVKTSNVGLVEGLGELRDVPTQLLF